MKAKRGLWLTGLVLLGCAELCPAQLVVPLDYDRSSVYLYDMHTFTWVSDSDDSLFSTTDDGQTAELKIVRLRFTFPSSLEHCRGVGFEIQAAGYSDTNAFGHEWNQLSVLQEAFLPADSFVYSFDYWCLWACPQVCDSGQVCTYRTPETVDVRNRDLLWQDCPGCTTLTLVLATIPGDHMQFVSGNMIWWEAGAVDLPNRRQERGVVCYPNPVTSVLHIEGLPEMGYSVYDILGRELLAGRTTGLIPVQTLPSGRYFLKLANRRAAVSFNKVR